MDQKKCRHCEDLETRQGHEDQLRRYAKKNNLRSLDCYVDQYGNCGFDSLLLLRNGFGGSPEAWRKHKDALSRALRTEIAQVLMDKRNTEVPLPPFSDRTGLIFDGLSTETERKREPFEAFVNRLCRDREFLEGEFLYAAPLILCRPLVVVMSRWTRGKPDTDVFIQRFFAESPFAHRRPVIMAHRNTPKGPHFYPLVDENDSRFLVTSSCNIERSVRLLLADFVGGSGQLLREELYVAPALSELKGELDLIKSSHTNAVFNGTINTLLSQADHQATMFDLLCRSRKLTVNDGTAERIFSVHARRLEELAQEYLNIEGTKRRQRLLSLIQLPSNTNPHDAEEALLFAAACKRGGIPGDAYHVYERLHTDKVELNLKSQTLRPLSSSSSCSRRHVPSVDAKGNGRPFLIITNGATGSGKSALIEKVMRAKGLGVHTSVEKFQIDALVETNPVYKEAIDRIIAAECTDKQVFCRELAARLKNPQQDILHMFADAYFKTRGKSVGHADNSREKHCGHNKGEKKRCDDFLDDLLDSAIRNRKNIAVETTGTYYVQWLLSKVGEYTVYYAFSLVSLCENIRRNKKRAVDDMGRYISAPLNHPAPRLPDTSFPSFSAEMTKILDNLETLVRQTIRPDKTYRTSFCLMVFDNNADTAVQTPEDTRLLYDSDDPRKDLAAVTTVIENIRAEIRDNDCNDGVD